MKGRQRANNLSVVDQAVVALCRVLADIPKEAMATVYLLCKLAYYSFFKSYSDSEERNWLGGVKRRKEPKIIFNELDLTENGINVTSEFDGFGLLKATHMHQLTGDTVTYNFLHLTVQEFLCSLYISTLSQQEQLNLLSEHFRDYPSVAMFLCGLTGLAYNKMLKFVCSKLQSSEISAFEGDPYVVTAVRSIYESNCIDPSQLPSPFVLEMSNNTLLSYDCLCLSWLLSYYAISQLKLSNCHIEDTGAKLLVRHYPNKNTTNQLLEVLHLSLNSLTFAGLENVMKLVRPSKPYHWLSIY